MQGHMLDACIFKAGQINVMKIMEDQKLTPEEHLGKRN